MYGSTIYCQRESWLLRLLRLSSLNAKTCLKHCVLLTLTGPRPFHLDTLGTQAFYTMLLSMGQRWDSTDLQDTAWALQILQHWDSAGMGKALLGHLVAFYLSTGALYFSYLQSPPLALW